MGRSRNTGLILVSQNAGDLLNEQVTNCLSAVFAFRSTERVEVANVMALLGVEASDENRAVLRGLGNGECVFRDLDGRAGRIGIDLISDEWRRRLDTNPTRTSPAQASAEAVQAGAAHTEAAQAEADDEGAAQDEAAEDGAGQDEARQDEARQDGAAQAEAAQDGAGDTGEGEAAAAAGAGGDRGDGGEPPGIRPPRGEPAM
jgi:hypothetical protein